MENAIIAKKKYSRLPAHIGIIPDGNRRWAIERNMTKESGYAFGIEPGFQLYEQCLELGIEEMTFYGFTVDNTKRPAEQRAAFQKACIDAVQLLANRDASLLVVGNTNSPLFPRELIPFTKRTTFGKGRVRINFLVNYGWQWDLARAISMMSQDKPKNKQGLMDSIASHEISRVDLIIRWGGRRRLSGFLPIQSIYADFFILEDLWPDFRIEHLHQALSWYEIQDVTLGG